VSFERIIVIGCSGSGKSTLAAALAARLSLPYTPTDPVYWTDDWRPAPATDVRAWADRATAAERWVLDGNFDAERDLVWGRAQLAVWLDLPLTTTLWRFRGGTWAGGSAARRSGADSG
jgi:adenylate kinase family enzyme